MNPLICSMCQRKCFFYKQNLLNVRTKSSKRPVTDFIKMIAQKTLSNESMTCVDLQSPSYYMCFECLDKIDVYDLAKSTLEKIEHEFGNYLSQGRSVLKNRRPNEGVPSNTNRNEAPELIDDGQIEVKISDKDESMDSFDFGNDNDDDDDEEDDSDNGIDINMYITDCKEPKPTFICTICNVDLKREDRLNEHSKLHNEQPPNDCVYCKRTFQQKKYLKPHIEMHLKKMFGIEEFLCDFCGRTFITKANLQVHLITHNEERKFKCDICGMTFKTKPHIMRHLISHSKTKSNICDICGRKFAHKSNMTAHKRQHNGEFEKTHDCSFCGASFPRKFKLKEHLEKNHDTILLHDGSVGPLT